MFTDLHVKYPLFLSDFHENLNFLYRFSKNSSISNFMKIRPMEPSCSMWKDRRRDVQTYMTKTILAFLNFANALKNY